MKKKLKKKLKKKWKNEVNEKNEKIFFLMKKWKNEKEKKEKMKKWKKTEKMKKNDEKRKKNEEIWLHTQNPRRFPGFTVVVVTFFVKILDDFHDFVSECVSFPWKINNPFWGVIVFPKKSDNFHWTCNKNTHFSDENERKKNR